MKSSDAIMSTERRLCDRKSRGSAPKASFQFYDPPVPIIHPLVEHQASDPTIRIRMEDIVISSNVTISDEGDIDRDKIGHSNNLSSHIGKASSCMCDNTSYESDSEDEIGDMVYQWSNTAKARAAELSKASEDAIQNQILMIVPKQGAVKTKRTIPAKESDAPPKKPRNQYRKTCNHEGCLNISQNGNVCRKHGAKHTAKISNLTRCPNNVFKGEVSRQHGAKQYAKQCSHEGCTNNSRCGGVCRRHGAELKKCSQEGCTNIVVKGGVCVRHGAKRKECSQEGCTNRANKWGVCIRHGAKRIECRHEGCTNKVVKGGVCIRHGATHKKCNQEGCTNNAIKGGVCWKHGANRDAKKCSHEGCTSNARRGLRGVCTIHSEESMMRKSIATKDATV